MAAILFGATFLTVIQAVIAGAVMLVLAELTFRLSFLKKLEPVRDVDFEKRVYGLQYIVTEKSKGRVLMQMCIRDSTRAVTQPVVSVTGVGKVREDRLVSTAGAKPGQDILVTKWIGIEGTSIIAKEKEKELLERFSQAFVDTAKGFDQYLSVPVSYTHLDVYKRQRLIDKIISTR